MTAENFCVPVIAGIGVGTAWALHALVHAPGWMIAASVVLTAVTMTIVIWRR